MSALPCRLLFPALVLMALNALPCAAAEEMPTEGADSSQGEWSAPPKDGKSWKHEATGLMFPQQLGNYRLLGEFRFKERGDLLIRYLSEPDRARADVFIFPHKPAPESLEEKRQLIRQQLGLLIANLQQMAADGRYKDVKLGERMQGELSQWQEAPLPLVTQTIDASRVVPVPGGAPEVVPVKQWVGVTFLKGCVVTIRHQRPADTGEKGETSMKLITNLLANLLKEPAMREDVRSMLRQYLADPVAPENDEAAKIVLAFIDQAPHLPVCMPQEPVSTWIDECEKQVPGARTPLLRAFILGSALAAMDEKGADVCLNDAASNLVRVYLRIQQLHPDLHQKELDGLVPAVARGQGGAYLRQFEPGAAK